jgi:hypothetical protein
MASGVSPEDIRILSVNAGYANLALGGPRYNWAMSWPLRLLFLILVASLPLEAATRTYLTGKVIRINSERRMTSAIFILYIEHERQTFSVRLREKPTYELDWVVNDAIEFRFGDKAIFLKRPNGKEMKFALLDPPSANGNLPNGTVDLPFPPQGLETGIDVARIPAEHRPRRCAEITAGGAQFEPLGNACLYALSSSNLPNFVCQETIQRATRGLALNRLPKGEWKTLDVVTAEVTVVSGRVEQYSTFAINGHALKLPSNADRGWALSRYLSDLHTGGLWSLTEFATVLGTVFSPVSQTNFSYVGDVEVPSGSANVFQFQLNAESNVSFVLAVSDLSYTPGLGGFLWTDRKTGQLLRVEANATELVSTFPIVSHYSATNYGDVPISGIGTFLLPTASETVDCQYPPEPWDEHPERPGRSGLRTDGKCYKNVISFHDCQKFVVESHISPDVSK